MGERLRLRRGGAGRGGIARLFGLFLRLRLRFLRRAVFGALLLRRHDFRFLGARQLGQIRLLLLLRRLRRGGFRLLHAQRQRLAFRRFNLRRPAHHHRRRWQYHRLQRRLRPVKQQHQRRVRRQGEQQAARPARLRQFKGREGVRLT